MAIYIVEGIADIYKGLNMNNESHGIDIRTLGDSGINIPFIRHNTSGRITMQRTQDSSKPVIRNPEEKLIDTGYSPQLNEHTYDTVIENDSIFLEAVKKYGDEIECAEGWTSITLFMHDIELNELVHYELTRYRILGNKFGVTFEIDEEYIFGLRRGDTIPSKTRLSWSNNSKGNSYKTGRNLNTFIGSIPETGEDCIMVSDSIIDDYAIDQIEEYETSYGRSSILANVHGSDTEYKGYPDIGDIIEAGDILFSRIDLNLKALKNGDFDIINNAMMFTKNGLRSRRPHFVNNIVMPRSGEVIDVTVYHNPKTGESMSGGDADRQTVKYLSSTIKYHNKVVSVYNDYERRYNGTVSPDTTNLIVEAFTFLETPIKGVKPKIDMKKKRSKLDMYTVKVTVRTRVPINQGFKITDLYGGRYK